MGDGCLVGTDCLSHVCNSLTSSCVASQCADGIKDGAETGVDCGGGICLPCTIGQGCTLDRDCQGNACNASTKTCAASQCSDNQQNGNETDVDCGGGTCLGCPLTKACVVNADCQTHACDTGTIPNTCILDQCKDHHQDGNETDVDCGGKCAACGSGQTCFANTDCVSQACDVTTDVCVADQCQDNHQDGNETDVDCGGSNACARCTVNQACLANSDCTTQACDAKTGLCDSSHCNDGKQDADEAYIDCGGKDCTPCNFQIVPTLLQTISVTIGSTTPTVTFNASLNGSTVNAGWSVDVGAMGKVTSPQPGTGVFTPSGTLGGTATITAIGPGNLTAQGKVFVKLTGTQNGANTTSQASQVVSTSPADLTVLVKGGGIGGVGGEGLGPAATTPQTTSLGTPTSGASKSLAFVYPYDATVWPRGMLAPLLQWSWTTGDADAIRIDLSTTTGSFAWTGTFGRPAILAYEGASFRKFIRHPIPQDIWQMATNTAGGTDKLTVKLTVLKGTTTAYGPISETWTIAPAQLSGTIYYQSYGTNQANNYTGAQGTPSSFGAGVLSIRGGDTAPKLVTQYAGCQVCHSVAAKGARLIVQQDYGSFSRDDGADYELSTTGATQHSPAPAHNQFRAEGFPAIYPDGSIALTWDRKLVDLPAGTNTTTPPTFPAGVGTDYGTPQFSPDGKRVAINPQDTVTNPGQELWVMDFDRGTNTFSKAVKVSTDGPSGNASIRPGWMAFFPDSQSVVYEHQLRASTADGNQRGLYTRKFAQGQIYWASAVASGTVTHLDKLNGVGYLPALATGVTLSCSQDTTATGSNASPVTDGDTTHTNDASYNYEPTVNPVSSGGYAWVVFTSRRMYGNVATIPPFCSDPRGVDLHADMNTNGNVTTKKLWVAAIDINAAPGTDASHPAFYLPAQELLAGNARGFWVLDPCRSDGASCVSGDQCCNGFCEPTGTGGALVCSSKPPGWTCSKLQETCTTQSDCCDVGALCTNGFCAMQPN